MKQILKDRDFSFMIISVCVIAGLAYFIVCIKSIKFPEFIPYNLSYAPRGNFIHAESAETKLEYKNVE